MLSPTRPSRQDLHGKRNPNVIYLIQAFSWSIQGPGDAAKQAEEKESRKYEAVSDIAEFVPFGLDLILTSETPLIISQ